MQRSGSYMHARLSTLVAGGTNDREIGDMAVSTYHGYFGYNWGEADAVVRPFFFGGLGATTFGEVTGTIVGQTRTISKRDAVLDDLGSRGKDLSRAGLRIARGHALDAHLHQDRRRRMVVRSVVWLLSGRQLAVLPPVAIQRRHHRQVLRAARAITALVD